MELRGGESELGGRVLVRTKKKKKRVVRIEKKQPRGLTGEGNNRAALSGEDQNIETK